MAVSTARPATPIHNVADSAAASVTASVAASVTDRAVAAPPARMLYVIWALFWLIMIMVAVQERLDNPYIHWWEPLLWEGSSCIAATVLMLVQRLGKQRYSQYLDQPLLWFGHHLRWLPPLAVIFISFVYAVRHGVYALVGDTYEHWSWPLVFTYETLKMAMFAGLWLGIIFGFDSFEQWQARRQRLLELQRTLAEAHLSHLKAQLRPHFLFNALNTISALMHVDVDRADRLLARLGDLLRASLQSSDQELTALREELRTLELFAQIMQERFADRVCLQWQIDPQALDAPIPAMLLQPLLENAFKHGVERSVGPVSIDVDAQLRDGLLVVSIRNTGSKLPGDFADGNYSGGVGLRNCRERLAVIYGDSARLAVTGDDEAVIATVTLPAGERAS
jgi:two-component system, LytTR family, sensor kinase